MQFLTAPEAISPALNRTSTLLFRPFRWSTYLKLCAVAVLTEGLSNFRGSASNAGQHTQSVSPVVPGFPGEIIPFLITAGLFALAVGIVIFYLIVRLRFALFECLVHQTRYLRPGWQRYRGPAWRFFLFSLVVGVAFLVVVAAILAPFASGFIQLFHQSQASGHLDFAVLIGLLLQLLPAMLILVLIGFAVDVVMRDFMLPHFALDNATAAEAWSEVFNRILAEKGAFLLYALLRILLPIVAMIGLFILLAIPMAIVFGGVAVFVTGLHASSAGGTPAGIFVEALAGLIAFVFGLFIAICFGGPVSIAVRNYALVFYGARYQALGNQLYPPSPVPSAPFPG